MTVDSLIDPGSSLGELVAERTARAQLFERLRLDYCCGGRQTLAAACAKRGLDLDEVRVALQALEIGSELEPHLDYDRHAALCNTHRALLDALEAFEQDLHRHVHEENNILLPRARKARPAPSSERSPASRDRAGADRRRRYRPAARVGSRSRRTVAGRATADPEPEAILSLPGW